MGRKVGDGIISGKRFIYDEIATYHLHILPYGMVIFFEAWASLVACNANLALQCLAIVQKIRNLHLLEVPVEESLLKALFCWVQPVEELEVNLFEDRAEYVHHHDLARDIFIAIRCILRVFHTCIPRHLS